MSSSDSLRAAQLIRGTNTTNIEAGIKQLNNLVKSAYPLDFDEVNYNLGLGYFRLGDVEELKSLASENPGNARLSRMVYYLESGQTPSGLNEPVLPKYERKKVYIIRNCGLLLAGGTLLSAFCLLN